MNAKKTKPELVARLRFLLRALANECQPEQFAAPLRAEAESVKAELAVLEGSL